jgi:glycosyltransferase involved in cell wall biosynthesis
MKLSILICTIPERKEMFQTLCNNLSNQKGGNDIEVIGWDIENTTIGAKRNALLGWANGDYVCFIDDDDMVSDNYVELLLDGTKTNCDCMSLRGEYSVDGVFDGLFEHSIRYDKWETVSGPVKYLRPPTPLNCIKASIAKQFKFPETNWAEDHDWSKQIHESGLIKTEHYIDQVIYYYKKVTR